MSLLPGPTGKAILDWQRFMPSAEVLSFLQSAFNQLSDEINPSSRNVHVYRWQDDGGQWHFSKQAPKNIQAEALLVDVHENILVPIPMIALADDTDISRGSGADRQWQDNFENGDSSLNPMKILEHVKAIKILAEQRNQALGRL